MYDALRRENGYVRVRSKVSTIIREFKTCPMNVSKFERENLFQLFSECRPLPRSTMKSQPVVVIAFRVAMLKRAVRGRRENQTSVENILTEM